MAKEDGSMKTNKTRVERFIDIASDLVDLYKAKDEAYVNSF